MGCAACGMPIGNKLEQRGRDTFYVTILTVLGKIDKLRGVENALGKGVAHKDRANCGNDPL